ncbi:MAG: hypothetical protein U0104_02970 [Gemmatimonadales bacterium]|nr:hypothetical protein [Gemmatimonadales bacterium]
MRRMLRVMTVTGGLLAAAQAVEAQGIPSLRPTAGTYAALVAVSPRRAGDAPWGTTELATAMGSRGKRREGSVLIIVGLAGIVTGLVIDESLVAVAGAGVAGVGLYLYLSNDGTIHVDP